MSSVTITNIVDLNKPKAPDPNKWTAEQIEEAKLVNIEPITVAECTALAVVPRVPDQIDPDSIEAEKDFSNIPNLELPFPEPPLRKECHGYIVMPDALQVKNLFKLMNVLVDEGTFKLVPQGLTFRAMDPSRVAMIDIVIPREGCEEHLCTEEIKFCFSIERFVDKTLKNITKNDAIRLDIQTGIVDKMNTRLTSKLTRQFSMPLLEPSEEEIPTPKINFNYSAKLVLEDVNTLFKDLEDHVRIIGTQDGLTFEQKGDIEAFTVALPKGDETILNIEAKEEAKATYSVSYLKEILKALNPLVDIVQVSYSTDMPIRISAEIEHLGTVNFYVAPRIETE